MKNHNTQHQAGWQKETPLRSRNGVYIQICGNHLELFSFGERRAQNYDGSGYNIFTGMEFLSKFDDRDALAAYMIKNKLKIEKDCSILNLPEHLYKTEKA